MTSVPTEKADAVTDHNEFGDDNVKSSDAAADAAIRGQAITGYEELTPWKTVKQFKMATAICFAAAFSAATDGYQIGINASIIANKGFVKQFGTEKNANGSPALASPILSGWASIMSVGQIVGMVALSFWTVRFGRKIAMYTYWLVLVSSIIAETVARSWEGWLVGKFLAGVGVGCLQSTIPAYISECAPPRIRGGLLMLYSFWWTLGSFFAQVALNSLNMNNPHNYLNPLYSQWAQIGLMLIIYIIIPESPAWCVTAGKMERAKKALLYLNRGLENYDVDKQLEIIVLSIEHERALAIEQRREKWYNIFRGTDGRRTVTSLWTNVSQQFIGLSLFGTFGTYFFQQAGLKNPFRIKVITSSIQIATVIVVVFVADRIGRRYIACCATTLSWLACIAIGVLGVVPRTNASTYVFILFACLWNVGLAANGATGWGFIGEISSQRLRPYTAGFGAAASCVVGVVMSFLVPYMTNVNKWNWSLKTAWFYVGVGAPFVAGMWYFIPETTGRSNAELDELFERGIKAWRFKETETATQRLLKDEQAN
ncbi:putative MFS alpha-glucoside transporter [Dendryphion nanum]|uniref:MFS alpha-glucoside transporter n=1 Tax=Dendryphion nanum TaxID=256645 RepID=A0A9P9CYL9_9PLEO|nr:putative MFS alpha-glucoside transporter [Dendryphion nanum]